MNPITIIRTTDANFQATFTNNGSPVDLTGMTLYFTVKSADNIDETDTTDAEAILQIVITSIPSPTTGIVNITIPNAKTSTIPAGNYLWDIKLVTSGGTVSAVQAGEFDVLDPVTNRNS